MPTLTTTDVATARSTDSSLKAEVDTFSEAAKPNRVAMKGEGVISSIRGAARERGVNNFGEIVRGSTLNAEQREKLMTIWQEARIDGRDFGKDIKALIPLLQQNPNVLDLLHKVAAPQPDPATGKITLFNQELTSSNKAEFGKMRQEFLAELLQGAVTDRSITQGPRGKCTGLETLAGVSAGEWLRIGAEYAVSGKAETAGGRVFEMKQNFFERAKEEQDCALACIKSNHPSLGMSMLIDGAMDIGIDGVRTAEGSYWFEYTEARRSLRGKESECWGKGGTVLYDSKTKYAVREPGEGVKELSQIDYVFTVAAETGHDRTRGVLIDTKWNHAQNGEAPDSMHGRHMIKAVGVTKGDDGHEYLVCHNPIGDFVDLQSRSNSRAEYVKPGTILGDKNGFWFKTGSDGIVYIRKDVLEANIQTVIVDYDEPYHVSSGKPVRSIGTMSSQVGVYEHPILFVQVDDPALRDLGQKEKTQVASSQGVRSSADEAPRSHHSSSKREVVDEGYGGSMKFGRKLEDDKRRLVEDEPVVNQKKPSPDQSSVGLAFGYGSDPAGSIRAPEAPMKPAEKEAKAEAKIATALPSATAKPENSQPPAPTLGSKALFS